MIQMSLYCFGYGRALEDLKVYITNHDIDEGFFNFITSCVQMCYCLIVDFPFLLGEKFISYINKDTLDLVI